MALAGQCDSVTGVEINDGRHRDAVLASENIDGHFGERKFMLPFFINGSITDRYLMSVILSQDQLLIWFNNYGGVFEGTLQSDFEALLEEFCMTGTRIVCLDLLDLSDKWRYSTCKLRYGIGELSWRFNSSGYMTVHVYNRFKR